MIKYIVEVSGTEAAAHLRTLFEKVGAPQSMHNFLIVKTDKPIESIRAISGVVSVEIDTRASIEGAVDQPNAPAWALPWISNTGGSYVNEKSGAGVDIYILDTGIRDTHIEFGGRVRQLYSHDGKSFDIEDDVSPSHGTNVAACAAGASYGTAKEANLVNCRTNFWNSDIIKALDVILRDHLDKPANVPSVLNFSGSSDMNLIGAAFQKVVEYGIVCVAAAGNYSEDRPRQPAASWYIEGVGSIDSDGNRSSFSNGGVSVYGPGRDILTAGVTSDTAGQVTSGTSFSSPYYAGLLACQLEGSSKFNGFNLATNLWFFARTATCDSGRMPPFANVDVPARSMSTRNQNDGLAQYYLAPSLAYSDAEILEFVTAHESQPAIIAHQCKDGNVDLARLVRVTGYTARQINDYFIAHNVTPWWFVDGKPVY